MERKLGALKNGRVFAYAGVNWVKLDDLNGGALVFSAESLFRREFDTNGKNDFAVSTLNRELNGDFLEALCREGAKKEDFVPLVLDLTSDDGMKDYGATSATIGLLTCERFRKYRALIPNLAAEDYWLLTPASCSPQCGSLVRAYICGTLNSAGADHIGGVRPICLLKFETLVSVEPEPGEEHAVEMDRQAEEAVRRIGEILNELPAGACEKAANGAMNAFAEIAMKTAICKAMTSVFTPNAARGCDGEQKRKEG